MPMLSAGKRNRMSVPQLSSRTPPGLSHHTSATPPSPRPSPGPRPPSSAHTPRCSQRAAPPSGPPAPAARAPGFQRRKKTPATRIASAAAMLPPTAPAMILPLEVEEEEAAGTEESDHPEGVVKAVTSPALVNVGEELLEMTVGVLNTGPVATWGRTVSGCDAGQRDAHLRCGERGEREGERPDDGVDLHYWLVALGGRKEVRAFRRDLSSKHVYNYPEDHGDVLERVAF
ncbi:hypothetical protein B0H17DRAFT_1088130 [Mycena rosella]|uniref:Uncharacterized protein n=1 Tax=Mycena rosella TaxID=1033263 RepID=A0AAD7G7V6_MYCRO|nr:hypothetical protein B0H17DRAFT_1088130 [Mycena rosella]